MISSSTLQPVCQRSVFQVRMLFTVELVVGFTTEFVWRNFDNFASLSHCRVFGSVELTAKLPQVEICRSCRMKKRQCAVFTATFLFVHVDFTDKLLMCSYCSSFGTQKIIDLPESKGKHIYATMLRLPGSFVAANCKLCPACRHSSQR